MMVLAAHGYFYEIKPTWKTSGRVVMFPGVVGEGSWGAEGEKRTKGGRDEYLCMTLLLWWRRIIGLYWHGSGPMLSKCAIVVKESGWAFQTGNNSGVIHSGIYYKPGSLTKFCREGSHWWWSFAKSNDIDHEVCGKDCCHREQRSLFENLYKRGLENGLSVTKLSAKEVEELNLMCCLGNPGHHNWNCWL